MNIVITGASKGIGFEIALELSKDPANHIIALSRNETQLKSLLKQAGNHNITIYKTDITTITSHEMEDILAPYKSIDILINNAGQLINKKFVDLSIDHWRTLFEINLFGTVNIIKHILPFLKKSSVSHIVNIGSMGGVQGTSKFQGLSAYSASKAALCNLTECLAEELKQDNVRVNCLALGSVNTEMLHDAFPDYKAPVDANDMGKFIARFSTTAHHFMNGKIVPVSITTP